MSKKLCFYFCLFFINGCGGGSSSSGISPSSQLSDFSSIGLSSSSSAFVKSEEIYYEIDEDQSLRIPVERYAEVVDSNWNVLPSDASSDAGGNISFAENSLIYEPKEDFYGVDEFYYLDYRALAEGSFNAPPKYIKVKIKINPVVDEWPKWRLDAMYDAGAIARIQLPIHPDTGRAIEHHESLQLSLGENEIPFRVENGFIFFNFPLVEIAGFYDLTIKDKSKPESKIITSIKPLVRVKKEDVTFYMGDDSLDGSVLVVVRNANVSDLIYEQWISQNLIPFLSQSIVKAHEPYWNFVVIDRPVAGKIHKDDASGAAWGDAAYYEDYVSKYMDRNTEIIVIDGAFFRATGGYPITMNVYNDLGTILHEVAHAHAKLGDEYAEVCERRPAASVKYYPNIENFFSGIEGVQWKHWIDDPLRIPGKGVEPKTDEEIGVFLGAFYCADKYERPAKATLMNSPDKVASAVDKEAWILANYENLGLLDSVVSEQSVGSNKLQVKKTLDPSLTSIRWFLNDQVLAQFEGDSEILIKEKEINESHYSVTAELIDLTGLVRNPHAYGAFNEYVFDAQGVALPASVNPSFRKTWRFEKLDSVVQKKLSRSVASSIGSKWVKHNILINTKGHQLLSSSVHKAAQVVKPVTGASNLMAEIVVGDSVLMRQGIELERFHTPDISPSNNNRFYTLVHPAVDKPYQIKIYSLPVRELLAVFDASTY